MKLYDDKSGVTLVNLSMKLFTYAIQIHYISPREVRCPIQV